MKNLRVITFLFLMTAVFVLTAGTAAAAGGTFGSEIGASGAHGSATNPYIIEDADDLKAIQTHITSNITKDKYYKIKDGTVLDLDGENWIPLGNSSSSYYRFSGKFDGNSGNNAKIINLNISSTAGNDVGLFGATGNATLSNITVENANIQTQHDYTGILIGDSLNTSITNCFVSGKIDAPDKSFIGGITGYQKNGEIKNTTAGDETRKLNINRSRSYVGGLAGEANGTQLNISDCSVTGEINSTNGSYIGGMAGAMVYTSQRMENLTTNVEIVAVPGINGGTGKYENGLNVGGMIGHIYHTGGGINNSSTAGNVTAFERFGGFIGKSDMGGPIRFDVTNSYATREIKAKEEWTGNGVAGGFYGDLNALVYTTNCYATGNVTSGVGGGFASSIGHAENCYATGDVISTAGGGGFANTVAGETVKNCYSTGDVTANSIAGGFAGSVQFGTIEDCYATGDVKSNKSNAGGLVGFGNAAGSDFGYIKTSFSTGNVEAPLGFAGGLVGNTTLPVMIENSYATGNVSGKVAGGLIGKSVTTNITNCYVTGNVDGAEYAGGLFGKVFVAPYEKNPSYNQFKYINNSMVFSEFINGTNTDYVGFYENDITENIIISNFGKQSGPAEIENIYVWNGVTNRGRPVMNTTDEIVITYDEIDFVKSYNVWQQYGKTGDSVWDTAVWSDTVWKNNQYDTHGNENRFLLPIFTWQDEDQEKPIADAVHLLYLSEIKIEEGPYGDGASMNFNITIDPKEVAFSHNYYNNWQWNLFAALTDDDSETEYNETSNFSVGSDIRSDTQSVYVTKKISASDLSGSFDPENEFYAWGKVELNDPYNGPGTKYSSERISEREAFELEVKSTPPSGNESKGGSGTGGGTVTGSSMAESSEPMTPGFEIEDEEPKTASSSVIILSFIAVAIASFVYRQKDESENE